MQEGDSAEVIDLDDEDDEVEKSSSTKTKAAEVNWLIDETFIYRARVRNGSIQNFILHVSQCDVDPDWLYPDPQNLMNRDPDLDSDPGQ